MVIKVDQVASNSLTVESQKITEKGARDVEPLIGVAREALAAGVLSDSCVEAFREAVNFAENEKVGTPEQKTELKGLVEQLKQKRQTKVALNAMKSFVKASGGSMRIASSQKKEKEVVVDILKEFSKENKERPFESFNSSELKEVFKVVSKYRDGLVAKKEKLQKGPDATKNQEKIVDIQKEIDSAEDLIRAAGKEAELRLEKSPLRETEAADPSLTSVRDRYVKMSARNLEKKYTKGEAGKMVEEFTPKPGYRLFKGSTRSDLKAIFEAVSEYRTSAPSDKQDKAEALMRAVGEEAFFRLVSLSETEAQDPLLVSVAGQHKEVVTKGFKEKYTKKTLTGIKESELKKELKSMSNVELLYFFSFVGDFDKKEMSAGEKQKILNWVSTEQAIRRGSSPTLDPTKPLEPTKAPPVVKAASLEENEEKKAFLELLKLLEGDASPQELTVEDLKNLLDIGKKPEVQP